MKTLTLSNLPWRAWSPSLFSLGGSHAQANLWIGYNGAYWLVGVNGVYGTTQYPTRDAAAAMIAKAFATAANQDIGA